MYALGGGESVRVRRIVSTGLPTEFTWRGQRHTVWSVERCHEPAERSRGTVAGRRVYQLRTVSGMRCLLSMDLRDGSWRMDRVLPARGG